MYRLMPMKPFDLVAECRQVGGFGNGAIARPLVLLGKAEVVGLVADGDAVLAEEDAEQPVELSGDLGEERRHVGGAERNSGGLDDFTAQLPDFLGVSVARRLSPGIVGIGDVPLLAHLVDEIGRDGYRLRRRKFVRPEAVAVALGGGQRGVEAHADHVDDLVFLEHRHAGEADVGKEAADVHIDIVFDQQLLSFPAPDVGLGLIVRNHRLERPAIDAARCVDAVDRHLQSDHRGLATERSRAGQRLQRADLVGSCRAECRTPRRRYQHGRAQHAAAPADECAAGHLAAVPDVLRPPFFFPFFSHRVSSLWITYGAFDGRTDADANPEVLIWITITFARRPAPRPAPGAAARAVTARLCPTARRGITSPPHCRTLASSYFH